MKSSLWYLFVVLFFFACNSSTKLIEKTWISKYYVYNEGTESEYINPIGSHGLFRFDKDSIVINDFQFIDVAERKEEKFKYTLHDTSLVLFNFNSNGNDSMSISLSDSLLTLRTSSGMSTVFEALPIYNQVKEKEKALNYLTSNTYKIVIDTFEIYYEFQKNHKSFNTTAHKKLFIEDIIYWNLHSSGTELFLKLDDFQRNNLHLKSITEKEIKGVIYGKENREVSLERVLPQNQFDLSNLIGDWEQIDDYPAMPPPPPPPPGRKYYEKEILKISANELIRHRDLGTDTVQWQINRLKDKIFIPKYFQTIGAWTIKKLDNEYLEIERKWINSSGLGLRWARRAKTQKHLIEQIKFRKVKK